MHHIIQYTQCHVRSLCTSLQPAHIAEGVISHVEEDTSGGPPDDSEDATSQVKQLLLDAYHEKEILEKEIAALETVRKWSIHPQSFERYSLFLCVS